MTDLATDLMPAEPPPHLDLPVFPLDNAYAALSSALALLANAQDVQWVSAAAADYRSEIAEVEVKVRRLMVEVDWCRDDWNAMRGSAWMAGQ